MKHILPVLGFVSLLAACSPPAYLPDGGRPRQTCQNNASIIGVKAQDLMGVPVAGATVTGRNTGTGKTQMGITDGSGMTNQITDDIGDGMIEITAVSGGYRTKQPFTVQVACGECDCTVMPGNATLTLE
jgi:hypothetical protein